MENNNKIIVTISGTDKVGIVAKVTAITTAVADLKGILVLCTR
jgi:predicted amino acid-binding ACT domain protein